MKNKYNYTSVGARRGNDNINYTHGMSNTRIYRIYKNILTRCNNKNNKRYKDYGGRGIVCEWSSFLDFKKDMYKLYISHINKFSEKNTTIDRIDNNGNYCKENCKWETISNQMYNKRDNVMLTYYGRTMCITKWAKELKVPSRLLNSRKMRLGWSDKKCIEIPVLTNETRVKGAYK